METAKGDFKFILAVVLAVVVLSIGVNVNFVRAVEKQPTERGTTKTLASEVRLTKVTNDSKWNQNFTSSGNKTIQSQTVKTKTIKKQNLSIDQQTGIKQQRVQWQEWESAAWQASKDAINVWLATAHFQNISIYASEAVCISQCLYGLPLESQLKAFMLNRGVPQNVASSFAAGVGEAWATWQNGVRVPELDWYPAFIGYSGPQAGPMPNVPMPLSVLVSEGLKEITTASLLEQRIIRNLGKAANSGVAKTAVENFSRHFSLSTQRWLSRAIIKNVMGKGPVPSWNPTDSSAGPVVGGSIIAAPPHIHGNFN